MAEFLMPSLGADMDEGTLLEWLVHPGDPVSKGDVIAVVDTAKAAVEVESFTTGVVESLLVSPGTKVPVGTPLALIGTGQAAPAPAAAASHEPPAAPAPAVPAPVVPAAAPPVRSPLVRHQAESEGVDLTAVHGTGPGGAIRREDLALAPHPQRTAPDRQRATPYARRLAEERGLDLATVPGTGPQGAVRARDLGAAPEVRAAPAPADGQRMRDAIARLMSRSKREIPHYYLRTTIDLLAATTWLREHNRSVPVSDRLVPAALLLAATARAAADVPQLNGYWVDGQFQPATAVHLGVAISLRSGGMVTPAMHDAQAMTPVAVMAQLRDLVERARRGRLRASELTDATVTVTNLGDQGVEEVLGVIYPPQVALVGFGAIGERPCAVDGLLGVRPLVTATLSADHRATDGYTGARFLNRIDQILQRPEEL